MTSQLSCNYKTAGSWKRIEENAIMKKSSSDFGTFYDNKHGHLHPTCYNIYASACRKTALFHSRSKNLNPKFSISKKKRSRNNFYHLKLHPLKSLTMENEQSRMRKGRQKVTNGMCHEKIGELSTVKSSFWINQATREARRPEKPKLMEKVTVTEKIV